MAILKHCNNCRRWAEVKHSFLSIPLCSSCFREREEKKENSKKPSEEIKNERT